MTAEQFLSELRGEYPKYNDLGLIDSSSVYRWIYNALNRFGGDIAEPREMIVSVTNGYAKLPSHYFDLLYAYKCEPYMATAKDKKMIPQLQNVFGYVTTESRDMKWCSCDECCVEETESHIVERIYINVQDRREEVNVYYRNPMLLRLGKRMMRDVKSCAADCRNRWEYQSPFEIIVNAKTLYANFDGSIYMRYRAIPEDDEGIPFIPDTALGAVRSYVESYVKAKLFENIFANENLELAGVLSKKFDTEARMSLQTAMRDAKMENFRLDSLWNIADQNRRESAIHASIWPRKLP